MRPANRWPGNKFSTPDNMPAAPKSFRAAKKIAFRQMYANHRTTFYCACGFDGQEKVIPTKCGYVPKRNNVRAKRIECERPHRG